MIYGTDHNVALSNRHRYKRSWWDTRHSFTRSIGFEIPFIFGFGKGVGEEPKAIITTSSGLALTRCSIHIIPILVSVTVLILNIGHSYMGRGLPGSIIDPSINIALLQIAAKAQEMLMVASVTTVVIHVLRLELISEEGLPLGIIGGAFLYSSLGYFWSPDFWGAFHDRSFSWSKFRVIGIVVLGGLIAAFAGPSTAVLLIPRDQTWPAGGSVTYMPGPAETWWPARLSAQNASQLGMCQSAMAVSHATCPGGGYPALWSARASINILGERAYISGDPQNLTTGFSFGPRTVDISSNVDMLPNTRYHGNYRGFACETSISGPRLAYAALQYQLKTNWIEEAFAIPYDVLRYGPSLSQYKYFGSMQVTTMSQIPAVRTACSYVQVLDRASTTVSFPVLPNDICWTKAGSFSSIGVAELNQSSTSRIRSTWVQLPSSFGSASGGLVLELPSAREGTKPVIGCSIDARWAPGRMNTYHLEQASSLENVASQVVTTTSQLAKAVPATQWVPGYSEFTPVVENVTASQIKLDPSWLNLLTPVVPDINSNGSIQTMTTLEKVITDTGLVNDLVGNQQDQLTFWNAEVPGRVNRTVALEWWIALMVADGLSREGSSKVIDTIDDMGKWSLLHYQKAPNFRSQLFRGRNALNRPSMSAVIKETTRITIGGYAYRITSITDYAAAGLLMLHILVAFVHTCYLLYTRRSSNSWDSLTELLVLVQNSRPAFGALHNTGAGIHDLKTYARRARIVAVREQCESRVEAMGDLEKVELVFEEDTHPNSQATRELHQSTKIVMHSRAPHTNQDIVMLKELQNGVYQEDFDARSSTREPRKFSNYSGGKQFKHSHHYSTSTEQLVQHRSIGSMNYDRIRVDQHYR